MDFKIQRAVLTQINGSGEKRVNVEECYGKIGENYAEVIRLFKTDERIIKYFKLMQKDANLDAVCKALEQSDYETAFRAAHTLKGLALNMRFTALANEASELTELLRSKEANGNILPLLSKTKRTYQTILACIDICLKNTAEGGLGHENSRYDFNCRRR